jgi:hypothetical protein
VRLGKTSPPALSWRRGSWIPLIFDYLIFVQNVTQTLILIKSSPLLEDLFRLFFGKRVGCYAKQA